MRTIANLEYHFLLAELEKELLGTHLNKLWQLGKKRFRFRFEGKDLVVDLGTRLNITKYIEDAPEQPSAFVQRLRKHLENARLVKIEQHNYDRVVVFTLQAQERFQQLRSAEMRSTISKPPAPQRFAIVFEMFSSGNLLFLDGAGKILMPLQHEEWKDRQLRQGADYKFPASQAFHLPPTREEISSLLAGQEKHLVPCLLALPLGLLYSREAAGRAGLPEDKPGGQLTSEEIGRLAQAIREMCETAKPFGFEHEGKLVEFAVTPLSAWDREKAVEFPSFNQLVDEYYYQNQEGFAPAPLPGQRNERVAIEKRILQQKAHLLQLEAEAGEKQQAAEAIYLHYGQVEELLAQVKQALKGLAARPPNLESEAFKGLKPLASNLDSGAVKAKEGEELEKVEKALLAQGIRLDRKNQTITIRKSSLKG